MPHHKSGTIKFNATMMDRSMVVPLTQEDKEQAVNLPLLNTLRSNSLAHTPSKNLESQPPSFYDEDQGKWKRKFAQSIAERQQFKNKYLKGRK